MVRGYLRLAMRLIPNEFELNQYSVWQIITEDLGMRKILERWFHTWDHPQHPHVLLWIFCAREKLLNETKLLLVDFLKRTESFLKKIFPNGPEI